MHTAYDTEGSRAMKRPFTLKSMLLGKPDPLPEITASVFLLSMTSFFLSALMTTLGGVIDGFIIGHTMSTTDVGALSLTSPMWFFAAVIYSILAIGCQPYLTQELSRGSREKASQIYSMTLITGVGITLALTVLTLLFSTFMTELLGASRDMEAFAPCRGYLIGASIGFPAMALITILSTGVNLEGARKWTLLSGVVVTVTNILLDLLIAAVHGGLFMMGLSTSVSYFAGAAVLILYYLVSDNIMMKPVLCRVSPGMIAKIAARGMPLGISRITATFKSFYLNHLLAASATAAGLAAYNVQVQLNYLTNDLFMSIARTMSMMLCLYYAEENRRELRYTVLIAVSYEIIFGLAITLLLRNEHVMPWISWFYLGNNTESYPAAYIAVYFFAIGLLGQALSVLFANYLQSIGRTMMSNIVYILSDAVLPAAFVSYRLRKLSPAVSDILRTGMIFAGASHAQLCMLLVLPVLILIVNRTYKNQSVSPGDFLLMLPRGFGVSADREMVASPRTLKKITEYSEAAYDFCLKHGAGRREAYYISLAAEEMADNILKHGFKDKGRHKMELRIICKNDSLILRIRDNSHIFDPIKKMSAVSGINDPSRYIGLKMVMKLADEVVYTSALKLNNLMIRIDLPGKRGESMMPLTD